MFASSVDLAAQSWTRDPLLSVLGGVADPNRTQQAFLFSNSAQVSAELKQTLAAPSAYQYCLSFYARSVVPSSVTLFQRGLTTATTQTFSVGASWTRLVLSGRLAEQAQQLTAGISIPAGQQIQLFGIQMEPQIGPSNYKPTAQNSAIYTNAHWAVDELTVVATGPDQFSTVAVIETAF